MTQPTQFQSTLEVKRWLEDQTATTITPVQTQAKKLKDDMNTALQTVEDISKLLLENSAKEIEKRNMKTYNRARALNKLAHLFLDRLKKISPPEQISYDTVSRYTQETQKVIMVTEIDIRNWFPRISPFFIMDRRKFLAVYEKAKQTYNALNDFVTKEYIKTKTLEETFLLINELQTVEKQLIAIQEEKEATKNERIPLEKEIAELEQKIEDLQTKGPIDKLNMINAEIENLSNELKNTLRHFQKPFIKMQALSTQGGGGGVRPDMLSKINQYLDNPFEALVTERDGYPMLREILEKLEALLAEDSLKLKPDKARKAEQSVNEVLHKNSLDSLQLRCREMVSNRDQLLASSKMDEIKRNLIQFQEQVDMLKARKTSIETHEAVKENAYKDTVDKINNLKRAIERNIYNSIESRVQIT